MSRVVVVGRVSRCLFGKCEKNLPWRSSTPKYNVEAFRSDRAGNAESALLEKECVGEGRARVSSSGNRTREACGVCVDKS
jgi:hypothetical protein